MHSMLIVVGAVAATFVLVAHSAQPAQPVVLKAAYLFDGKSGRLTSGGTIVVEGDKIVSIGGAAPVNAKVIDLGNATLLPGFIDAHAHLADEMDQNFYRGFYQRMLRFPAEQAHYAALYAKRTLEAGFTTIRDLGGLGFIDIGLRNAIDAGAIAGPRLLTAAHAIGSTGGHCDISPFPPELVTPPGPIQGVCKGYTK